MSNFILIKQFLHHLIDQMSYAINAEVGSLTSAIQLSLLTLMTMSTWQESNPPWPDMRREPIS